MASQVTLGVIPLGGGTLQPALTESIWLGGTRFLTVYTQRTPNMINAQITDLSADPYAGGTPAQIVTTNQNIINSSPLERPMLVRMDSNRVLMIWSAVNQSDSYIATPTTLAFDATVLEIDSSNNIYVRASLSQVLPNGAMNSTQSYYQPTATKGIQGSLVGNPDFVTGPGFSTYLSVSADGASINRVLASIRYASTNQNGRPVAQNFALYDIQYNVASMSLTVVQRFLSPTISYGFPTGSNTSYIGPSDFAWVYAIPNTSNVICGFVNYDPTNGVNLTGTTDVLRSLTNQTQFITGNNYYVFDITQAAATWTAGTTISTGRKASVVAPLDSDRMLELTSQGCATGTTNYGRVYSLSAGTWGADIVTDASNAITNKNGSLAYGLINQITMLGNDRMILSVTSRAASATAGAVGTAYYGFYRLLAGILLQASASFGVPVLAPLTFQRGQDALIRRTAGQDPNLTSPNVTYDLYGRTGQNSFQFLRYPNPM